jgi:hypothetical protein
MAAASLTDEVDELHDVAVVRLVDAHEAAAGLGLTAERA